MRFSRRLGIMAVAALLLALVVFTVDAWSSSSSSSSGFALWPCCCGWWMRSKGATRTIVNPRCTTCRESSRALVRLSSTGTKFHGSYPYKPINDSDPVFDTIMRFELKQELLQSVQEFQDLQELSCAKQQARQFDIDNKRRLFHLRRWLRHGRENASASRAGADQNDGLLLAAQSLAAVEVDMRDKGQEVIALAERLATLNVDMHPLRGWMGHGDTSPDDCALNGKWNLCFTSGNADAPLPSSPKRGRAITSQIVNATAGTLVNVVDFESRGKLKGFRVVVEGRACSDTEMDLTFRKIVVHRDSRFPRLLGRITIPLPSFRFLSAYSRRALSRRKANRSTGSGPGFQIQYMDSDMRIHKTRDCIWFIQTRMPAQ